jgi:hypothetical protein
MYFKWASLGWKGLSLIENNRLPRLPISLATPRLFVCLAAYNNSAPTDFIFTTIYIGKLY